MHLAGKEIWYVASDGRGVHQSLDGVIHALRNVDQEAAPGKGKVSKRIGGHLVMQ